MNINSASDAQEAITTLEEDFPALAHSGTFLLLKRFVLTHAPAEPTPKQECAANG